MHFAVKQKLNRTLLHVSTQKSSEPQLLAPVERQLAYKSFLQPMDS